MQPLRFLFQILLKHREKERERKSSLELTPLEMVVKREVENFRKSVCPPLIFYFFVLSAIVHSPVVIPDSCSCRNGGRSAIFYRGGGRGARFSRGRQVSTVHVDRGASNKECSSRQPEKAGWTRGRRTTDRNTCTDTVYGNTL